MDMHPDTIPQPGRARCYRCGSDRIFAVCHHCGRPMCEAHAGNELPVALGFWRALALRLGWKKPSAPKISAHMPGFTRLPLLDEFWVSLGLAKVVNPEFDGLEYEPKLPPRRDPLSHIGPDIRRLWRLIDSFLGLGDKKRVAEASHCELCAHGVVRYLGMISLGIVVAVAAIFLLLVWWLVYLSPTPAPIPLDPAYQQSVLLWTAGIFSFGLLLILAGLALNFTRYFWAQREQLPSLPVEVDVGRVRAHEVFSGSIRMDPAGHYISQRETEIQGRLLIPLRVDSSAHYRRLGYQQKAARFRVKDVSEKKIHSGFLLLGRANWEFPERPACLSEHINVVPLHHCSEYAKVHSFLADTSSIETRLELTYRYRVGGTQNGDGDQAFGLPVQVILSLRPGSDRRALDLELELISPHLPRAGKVIIQRFDLWLPVTMGRIERLQPEGRLEENSGSRPELGPCQHVIWKRLTFHPQHDEGQHCPILIQFQNPIDKHSRLQGELQVHLPMLYSDAEPVRFFTPWGACTNENCNPADFAADTLVNITLDLNLDGLRYQTFISLNDRFEHQAAVPDSALVTRILDKISDQEFYVKRIIENPTHTSKEGAHKIHHYWDISGRKYDGVYPMDFHFVLAGEEEARGVGNLKVIASVQGAVTDEAMAQRVTKVMSQLVDLIRLSL
jgi:hypothetical protein